MESVEFLDLNSKPNDLYSCDSTAIYVDINLEEKKKSKMKYLFLKKLVVEVQRYQVFFQCYSL